MGEILVSICCITYNHEKFIRDAIDSFLMQKTNFQIEILIYDDASTDQTADIIREYEEKYSELIKPIYQNDNQYSKKVQVDRFNIDRAKGKYIALCEGDDFWTDPYKLQKQFDFMEAHPDYSLCVHAGSVVTANEKKLLCKNRTDRKNKTLSVEDIILIGGDFCLTNSMFYRSEYDRTRPNFFQILPDITDYHLAINLALQGKVYYMDEFMSAYRTGDQGSWTQRNLASLAKKREHYRKVANMLDEINQYTNLQYNKVIQEKKTWTEFDLLVEERKFKEVKSEIFQDIYRKLTIKRKIMIKLDEFSPNVAQFLRRAKRSLTNGV